MYVLVADVKGLKYFVQKHRDGSWLLNGLKNNAHKFESKDGAWKIQQMFSTRERPITARHIDDV